MNVVYWVPKTFKPFNYYGFLKQKRKIIYKHCITLSKTLLLIFKISQRDILYILFHEFSISKPCKCMVYMKISDSIHMAYVTDCFDIGHPSLWKPSGWSHVPLYKAFHTTSKNRSSSSPTPTPIAASAQAA